MLQAPEFLSIINNIILKFPDTFLFPLIFYLICNFIIGLFIVRLFGFPRYLILITVASFFVNAVFAILTQNMIANSSEYVYYLLDDPVVLDRQMWDLAEVWRQGRWMDTPFSPYDKVKDTTLNNPISWIYLFNFWVFGHERLALRFFFSLFGSIVVTMLYPLVRSIFNINDSIQLTTFAIALPAFVYWAISPVRSIIWCTALLFIFKPYFIRNEESATFRLFTVPILGVVVVVLKQLYLLGFFSIILLAGLLLITGLVRQSWITTAAISIFMFGFLATSETFLALASIALAALLSTLLIVRDDPIAACLHKQVSSIVSNVSLFSTTVAIISSLGFLITVYLIARTYGLRIPAEIGDPLHLFQFIKDVFLSPAPAVSLALPSLYNLRLLPLGVIWYAALPLFLYGTRLLLSESPNYIHPVPIISLTLLAGGMIIWWTKSDAVVRYRLLAWPYIYVTAAYGYLEFRNRRPKFSAAPEVYCIASLLLLTSISYFILKVSGIY